MCSSRLLTAGRKLTCSNWPPRAGPQKEEAKAGATKALEMMPALNRGVERITGVSVAELGLKSYFGERQARTFHQNATACLKELDSAEPH